jgi:hypothetical protein
VLTSEQGGKTTCTKASGCTKFWPETLLASGVTAAKVGSGVQASMLGTVTDASGTHARFVDPMIHKEKEKRKGVGK